MQPLAIRLVPPGNTPLPPVPLRVIRFPQDIMPLLPKTAEWLRTLPLKAFPAVLEGTFQLVEPVRALFVLQVQYLALYCISRVLFCLQAVYMHLKKNM